MLTLDESLRRAEDRAAMLRYLADSAATYPQPPNRAVLSGIADACAELRQLTHRIRRALSGDAREIEVPGVEDVDDLN